MSARRVPSRCENYKFRGARYVLTRDARCTRYVRDVNVAMHDEQCAHDVRARKVTREMCRVLHLCETLAPAVRAHDLPLVPNVPEFHNVREREMRG